MQLSLKKYIIMLYIIFVNLCDTVCSFLIYIDIVELSCKFSKIMINKTEQKSPTVSYFEFISAKCIMFIMNGLFALMMIINVGFLDNEQSLQSVFLDIALQSLFCHGLSFSFCNDGSAILHCL